MNTMRTPLFVGIALAFIGMGVGAVLTPVAARIDQPAPIQRTAQISITTTNPKQSPKAHWGIYALSEYDYSASGKMTTIKKNDLIVEEDMSLFHGGSFTRVQLKSGEYEIHVQPDSSRTIIKRFIVNNLSTAAIPLGFDTAPIEDDAERNKTEVVRIGPSLGDLEARIQALEKKEGITSN